jgi:heptosyltransferase-3
MVRVLVIQLRRLGDILMTTPLLRQLRRRLPDARIEVLCETAGRQLLEHNPHLDEILTLPARATSVDLAEVLRRLRARRYDWVVDCQGLPKTAVLARLSGAPVRLGFGGRWWRSLTYSHRYVRRNSDYSALDKLKLLDLLLEPAHGTDWGDLQSEFPVSEEARREAEWFCRTQFPGPVRLAPARPGGPWRWPVVALFGVSRQPYKVWPAERLAEVGRRLAERGFIPWLVHGPGEEAAAREVARAMGPGTLVDTPLPSFPALKEILARCALFVGNDGGPKHLAALAGIPTVAVFGRVHPEAWTRPDDPLQRWVATASHTRRVPTVGPCEVELELADISVDSVWREVEVLLGHPILRLSPRPGVGP